jgi:hypothetical protein
MRGGSLARRSRAEVLECWSVPTLMEGPDRDQGALEEFAQANYQDEYHQLFDFVRTRGIGAVGTFQRSNMLVDPRIAFAPPWSLSRPMSRNVVGAEGLGTHLQRCRPDHRLRRHFPQDHRSPASQ